MTLDDYKFFFPQSSRNSRLNKRFTLIDQWTVNETNSKNKRNSLMRCRPLSRRRGVHNVGIINLNQLSDRLFFNHFAGTSSIMLPITGNQTTFLISVRRWYYVELVPALLIRIVTTEANITLNRFSQTFFKRKKHRVMEIKDLF